MPIPTPLLIIGSTPLTDMIQEYKVASGQKLWNNPERTMSGSVTGSMIGLFPKLEIVFRPHLTQAQVKTICDLLNQPFFNATYWDAQANGMRTAAFYSSDFVVEVEDARRGLYKGFTVSLVPKDPRA